MCVRPPHATMTSVRRMRMPRMSQSCSSAISWLQAVVCPDIWERTGECQYRVQGYSRPHTRSEGNAATRALNSYSSSSELPRPRMPSRRKDVSWCNGRQHLCGRTRTTVGHNKMPTYSKLSMHCKPAQRHAPHDMRASPWHRQPHQMLPQGYSSTWLHHEAPIR